MRVTVVGCSGSYPGPDSPGSCYLVEAEWRGRTYRILLDLGSGALGSLHRFADPLGIDAVFFTHLHPDHCMDLCGYYVLRKHHPSGPQPRIPVYGPVGTADRMARAYDLPVEPGMTREFGFHEYADQAASVGPFTVAAIEVVHPVPAFCLRVEAAGRTLVYSGDTGVCDAFAGAARGADLLLAEASFREGVANPSGLHLTGADVGKTAAAADVRRVVLTHIPPWYDPQDAWEDARSVYDGELSVAALGAVYDV